MIFEATKKCNRCNTTKSCEDFHKQTASPDGYTVWCKSCAREHKQNNKEHIRNKDLLRKYGISHQDYLDMLNKQDGKCAVCGLPETQNIHGKLCVDHNHETGKVRGLLCNPCNKALGLAMDSAEILYNLYKYKLHHDEVDYDI
jgi:hypothetical protein